MVDLGLCGLGLSVFLFIVPSAIYLTYGFKCYAEIEQSKFCWNVDREMAVVLTAFGFVFLIFGTVTCVFALVVWRTNRNCNDSDDNEITDDSLSFV